MPQMRAFLAFRSPLVGKTPVVFKFAYVYYQREKAQSSQPTRPRKTSHRGTGQRGHLVLADPVLGKVYHLPSRS